MITKVMTKTSKVKEWVQDVQDRNTSDNMLLLKFTDILFLRLPYANSHIKIKKYIKILKERKKIYKKNTTFKE